METLQPKEPEVIGYQASCMTCTWTSEQVQDWDDAFIEGQEHIRVNRFGIESHPIRIETIRGGETI